MNEIGSESERGSNHAGLLPNQIEELCRVRAYVLEILDRASSALIDKEPMDDERVEKIYQDLQAVVNEYDQNQIMRIQDNTSKTRLSILFYGFIWNALRIAEQTLRLVKIFKDPLKLNGSAQ